MRLVLRKRKTESADVPESPLKTSYNPYLAARREWDERYGDMITRAKNWRLVAVLSAVTATVSVAGIVILSARSKVVPFVVAIDSLGRTVSAGPAEETTTADERLKQAALFSWIEEVRLVTIDPIAQRKAIDRVYAHLAMGSEAQAFVTAYYRNDPPQKRSQTQTVSIDVKSVLPNSDRTYEIEWIETTHDLNGGIVSTDHWKGSFTIALNPPTDERLMRASVPLLQAMPQAGSNLIFARFSDIYGGGPHDGRRRALPRSAHRRRSPGRDRQPQAGPSSPGIQSCRAANPPLVQSAPYFAMLPINNVREGFPPWSCLSGSAGRPSRSSEITVRTGVSCRLPPG
jgi:type IV secretion system protein VirB5